jgi:MFS family permease
VYAVGLAVFAVAYVGLGVARSSGWVWLLLPLYGVYTALTDGVGKAWISDLLPTERLGTGLGVFQGLQGGAAVIAGLWAGLAWGGTGRFPFVLSGVIVAVLAMTLLVAGKRLEGTD